MNDKLAEAKSDNMIKKENEIKQLKEELNKYKNQKMDDNDLYVELEEMKKKKMNTNCNVKWPMKT